MRKIWDGIISIAKALTMSIKKILIKIKHALMIVFNPIFSFFYSIVKGIVLGLKIFFLYTFIKPILFLYHYVVIPIGKALQYVLIKAYSYLIRPPLKFIHFLFLKIAHFFTIIGLFLNTKILQPIFSFLKLVSYKIGYGIKWFFKRLGQIFTHIFKFIYHKLIYPVIHFLYIIFDKIGYFIVLFFEKIIYMFVSIIQYIYYKLLEPIGYFIWFLIKKIRLGLRFLVLKIYLFFEKLFKFIYYKLIQPVCHFIYCFILKPIYTFFSFVFEKIYQFFSWLFEKILILCQSIGHYIWKGLKFLYQFISVGFVVTISAILCLCYTLIIYPFRIIIETKSLILNDKYSFIKKWLLNPYYLFLSIKEKNNQQLKKYQEKKVRFTYFHTNQKYCSNFFNNSIYLDTIFNQFTFDVIS